ncbi:hypothetical protein [Flavobacterium sp.]|uniref:hypothetical protein n=1 Tax=Flavobacterium sp. TaxID=239 RepID=UPI00286E93B3|nr:hypothetical protein [Flavobacterium sp.]
MFNISKIYKFSVSKGYYICSEILIDKLINQLCEKESGDFVKAYLLAKKEGLSFNVFYDSGNSKMNLCRFPRFGETDFEIIVNLLGGNKISETENRTPDFVIKNHYCPIKKKPN